jgi:hypothetical protein
MAWAFTKGLRVGILVGLSPATYPGGISLPSAQAADAEGHAGLVPILTGSGERGLVAEQPTSLDTKQMGSSAFEPSNGARRRFE